jgi:hypothetical protein
MKATDPNVPSGSQNAGGENADLPRGGALNAAPATGPKPGTAAPAEAPARAMFLGESVGKLLGVIARFLDAAFVEQSLTLARTAGHYAVTVGGALTLVYAIYVAAKLNSFTAFVAGLGLVIGIAVAQFAAQRLFKACELAVANTPSAVSSMAFLECVGLLAVIGALVTLIVGVVAAIELATIVPLMPAILFSLVLTYFGAVALHPELVNVTLANGTAGEEAIGLLAFFLKNSLKIVPITFCVLAVGGGIALLASFVQSGQNLAEAIGAAYNAMPLLPSLPYGLAAAGVVMLAALLPLIAYFSFVLEYLLLDVCRAILSVPGKLDLLRRP